MVLVIAVFFMTEHLFLQNIFKGGIVKPLVQKTYSTDDEIRLNALWALRNATFNARRDDIILIMEGLTWDHYTACVICTRY